MESWLRAEFEKSPFLKTLVGIFSIVVFSVLSGAFVAEITVEGKVQWFLFYKTASFYLLVLCSFLMYLYYKFQLDIDVSVEKFKDDDYCKAYMRKQCLPELAKKTNDLIKEGKTNGRLKDIMTDLKL